MSMENLQNFYCELRTDVTLINELQSLPSESAFLGKVVELGASKGYEFTVAEVESALNDPAQFFKAAPISGELSDLELRAISGGVSVLGVLVGHNFQNPDGSYGRK